MSTAPVMPSGSGGSGDSGSLYDSGASNLDILNTIGNELIDQSSPATPPGAPPTDAAGSAVPPPVDGAGAAGEAAKPEWFETAPDQLKGLLAHQNISADQKKWLEETFGELNTFKGTPIGTKEAVQELAELYPGGMDDIREAYTNAQEFVKEMAQFNSGDPGQQTELLATLIQQNPDAYVSMLGSGAELLKQTLRDDYTSFASNLTHDHLETITDGKFAQFFDGLTQMAKEYTGLSETNPEQAAKIASKLGGMALQMADWWGSAKNKLGYGEKASMPVGSRQPAVVPRQEDQREVGLAQREANFFASNYILKHDQSVNPLISSAMTRELAARKLDLPQSWQQRVIGLVSQGIKDNLHSDKTYLALENRIYRRGAPNDPRKWDNSDVAARTLLAAAKQRAEKLVPTLLKRALDDIATLRGGAAPKAQPAAGVRSAGGPTNAGGGGNNSSWEEDLKAGKISGAEAVQRMAGV